MTLTAWRVWSPNVRGPLDDDTFYAPSAIVGAQMWATHLYGWIQTFGDRDYLTACVKPEAGGDAKDTRAFMVNKARIVECVGETVEQVVRRTIEEMREEVELG